MFHSLYKDFGPNYSATAEYTDFDIEKAIIMHEGDTIAGFPSVDVFIYLIQPMLEKLREPGIDLLADVYNYLEMLCKEIVDRIFVRFPTLMPDIMDVIVDVLVKQREEARMIVESLIDSEQNYLFTNDPEYLAQRTDIVPPDQDLNNPQMQQ